MNSISDGRYNQDNSGTATLHLDIQGGYKPTRRVASGEWEKDGCIAHWVARLRKPGKGATQNTTWVGDVWRFRSNDGTARFNLLEFEAGDGLVTVRYFCTTAHQGDESPQLIDTRSFKHASEYFRSLDIEVDSVEGEEMTIAIEPCEIDPEPARGCDPISLGDVFAEAGFKTTVHTTGVQIPSAAAGDDARWTDMELHDAMLKYWSLHPDARRWAVWTLFAGQYVRNPTGMFGIMFDNIGPKERQGVAIFNQSDLGWAPDEVKNPEAFKRRARFFYACHEIGHTFNLSHTFQRELMWRWHRDLQSDPSSYSFMNYSRIEEHGGYKGFWPKFNYRFDDDELEYLRHAPAEFVQPGGASWLRDDMVLESGPSLDLRLDVATGRATPTYQFMEPVELFVTLTNDTESPAVIPGNILRDSRQYVVLVQREDSPIRVWRPLACRCESDSAMPLYAGQWIGNAFSISRGAYGPLVSEPGRYRVRVMLQNTDGEIRSPWLHFRVTPPVDRLEEVLAQEYFSNETTRVLAFGGTRSRILESGKRALLAVASQLPTRRVAYHAAAALSKPLFRESKRLVADVQGKLSFEFDLPDSGEYRDTIGHVHRVVGDSEAPEVLGHPRYARLVADYGGWLTRSEDPEWAARLLTRKVRNQGIRPGPGLEGDVATLLERSRDKTTLSTEILKDHLGEQLLKELRPF